jgi:hypothetical protein
VKPYSFTTSFPKLRPLSRPMKASGFIVSDFADQGPAFLEEVGQWLRKGKIRYREDVVPRRSEALQLHHQFPEVAALEQADEGLRRALQPLES